MNGLYLVAIGDVPARALEWIESASAEWFPFPIRRLPALSIPEGADRALTSTNIPWIFRLPQGTPLSQALQTLSSAIEQAGPNRASIRELLASGKPVAGLHFKSTGELK